jgi:DNA-binding Lrp family transcriptional regulator
MADHRTEVLQIIQGSPDPSLAEIASQIGDSEDEVRGIIEGLERDGHLTREDGRLVVVEPSVAPVDEDEDES